MKKRFVWVALGVLAIGSVTWGNTMMTMSSAGGIGMIGGQMIGTTQVPGAFGGDIGVRVSVFDLATQGAGTVLIGNNTQCTGNSSPCENDDQQCPSPNPGCWPNWPIWFRPWGNVTTSSNSAATTIANGPDCMATAETSGMSVGPGASSSSHSYAQSVNP